MFYGKFYSLSDLAILSWVSQSMYREELFAVHPWHQAVEVTRVMSTVRWADTSLVVKKQIGCLAAVTDN